jgi:hypothetical protein
MPLPVSALFAFARSPLAKWLGAGLVVSGIVWYGHSTVFDRGVAACKRDAVLSAAHAQEEAHQTYLAEVERGNALSAELVKTQRRLNETKSEYLAYANGIVGNCPAELGLFLAAEEANIARVPEAARAPVGPADGVAASAIAGNIAENRWRFEANRAQCAALIEWHARSQKPVTSP